MAEPLIRISLSEDSSITEITMFKVMKPWYEALDAEKARADSFEMRAASDRRLLDARVGDLMDMQAQRDKELARADAERERAERAERERDAYIAALINIRTHRDPSIADAALSVDDQHRAAQPAGEGET